MEEFVIVSHLGILLFLVNVKKIGKIEIVIVVTGKFFNKKRKRKKNMVELVIVSHLGKLLFLVNLQIKKNNLWCISFQTFLV